MLKYNNNFRRETKNINRWQFAREAVIIFQFRIVSENKVTYIETILYTNANAPFSEIYISNVEIYAIQKKAFIQIIYSFLRAKTFTL